MGMAKGLMGGNAFDALMADAAAQDPEGMEKMTKNMPQLGANPFALMGQAPKLPGGLPPEFFGKGKK
jgi:hypothetical protein